MRWIAAVVCAGLITAGCDNLMDRATDDSFAQGLAAYRAGDREALRASIAALSEEGVTTAAPCSVEGMAAARNADMKQTLEKLDRSVFSMSEEARFVFYNAAMFASVDDKFSEPVDCRRIAEGGALLQDGFANQANQAAYMKAANAWHEALVVKYGAQLAPRLKAAGRTLEANHLNAGDWGAGV